MGKNRDATPSLAKLARPVSTRVFARERTFDLLDRLRQQPVIWISGPAGCGKTTLASSYIETRRLPCLWYRLDRGNVPEKRGGGEWGIGIPFSLW